MSGGCGILAECWMALATYAECFAHAATTTSTCQTTGDTHHDGRWPSDLASVRKQQIYKTFAALVGQHILDSRVGLRSGRTANDAL